jgi:hypothetical protein
MRHITQWEKCITTKESKGANTEVAVNNKRTISVFANETNVTNTRRNTRKCLITQNIINIVALK